MKDRFYKIIGVIGVVLIFIFRDLILSFLIGRSKELYNETKEKDHILDKEISGINKDADRLKEDANNLAPDKVNEDWHLKGKK